jgi:protein MPE1
MFIDPMKTPCCEKTYCNDCITNALIESDFTCPGCQTDEVLIDNLKPDEEMSRIIKDYVQEKDSVKEIPRSGSPSTLDNASEPATTEPTANKAKSASPKPRSPGVVSSPNHSSSEKPVEKSQVIKPVESDLKKRPADELLENPKIPKAPKAMQQQEAQRQAGRQHQAMMNSMNPIPGFPNAPFDMSQQFGGGYGMGMGMSNMNMMNTYGMMNPMMNPMMAMNGFPMNGGFLGMNMPGMNVSYGGGYGGVMGSTGGGFNNGNTSRPNIPSVIQPGEFPNQQKTVFAATLPNEEDNAYFRNPVNPHRHQGRQKRTRPSDYREL